MEQKIDQVLEMEHEQIQEVSAPVTVSNIFSRLRNIVLAMFALVFVTIMFYSASTWSYYTDGVNSATNTIVGGSLDVELIEMSNVGGMEVPFENPVRIVPSLKVSKIVKIKNTGTLPMQVRIKIDITIDKDEATLPDNWRSLISCNFDLDNEETGHVGSWELRADGYYYYILPLEASKVTTPLFDTITFLPEMGNEFTNSEIRFTVICEAIQLEADVWPEDESADNGGAAVEHPELDENAEADTTN